MIFLRVKGKYIFLVKEIMYFLFAKKEELSPINKQCNEEFNGFGPRILFYGERRKN